MNQMEILEKEIEICHMENVQLNSILENDVYIDQFMEDGDNKSKGFFQKLKIRLMELFEKIKDLFKRNSASSVDERMREYLEKLEKAKLTAIDGHKVFEHSKKYQDKIKNAKYIYEINKIVDDYKKRTKELTAAGAFALIFTGTGIAVYNKRKAIRKSNFEEQERSYSQAMEYLNKAEAMTKDMNKLKNDTKYGDTIKRYTNSALAKVNNVESHGKSISDEEIDLIACKARNIFAIADESIVMTQTKEMIDRVKRYGDDIYNIAKDDIKLTSKSTRIDVHNDSRNSIDRFKTNHRYQRSNNH